VSPHSANAKFSSVVTLSGIVTLEIKRS
jgi:hypothetical protein